jgi:hypothetical protein
LNTSVERAKFVRQLYNLRDLLDRDEETEGSVAEIERLQDKINQRNEEHTLKSFYTKDGNERRRLNDDVNGQGAGGCGGAGGVSGTDCAELGAHGYEVKPRAGDIMDGKGGVMKSYSKVRQPLSTYAPR